MRVFRLAHLNEIPVLCPIACEIDSNAPGATRHALALEHLDGLRVEGALSLMREGAVIASEAGEVLFRPYGISGIAALNLSREDRAPVTSSNSTSFPAWAKPT